MFSKYFSASNKIVLKAQLINLFRLFCLLFFLYVFGAQLQAQTCTPPPAPTITAVAGPDFDHIQVTWNTSTLANSYSIYVSEDGVNWGPPTGFGYPFPPTITFTWGGQTFKTYYFYVKAFGCNNTVATSNIASATTFDIENVTPSATPGPTYDQITISWATKPHHTFYTVLVSPTGLPGSYFPITSMSPPGYGTPFPPTLSYTHAGQTYKQYYFYIRSSRNSRQKDSNVVSATTFDIGVPSLSLSQLPNNQIRLNWNVAEGATSHLLYAFSTANNSWSSFHAANAPYTTSTLSYTTTISPNRRYSYYVTSKRNDRQRPSNIVDVFLHDEQDAGEPTCNTGVGKPVNVTNGNMYLKQTDYVLPGIGENINVTRSYNSIIQTNGLFGRGWSTLYDENVSVIDNYSLKLTLSDGRAVYFARNTTTAAFLPVSPGFYGDVMKRTDGTYRLTFKDGRVHEFNSNGKLTALSDRNGNQTTLNYNITGQLSSITDVFGRSLNITLNSSGFIEQIGDSQGLIATYTYTNNELQNVTYPDSSKYQFEYVTINGKRVLTFVKDALNNVLEKHEYDSQARATTSEVHGGVEKYTLDYSNLTATPAFTQVTDAIGRVTKYYVANIRGRNVVTKTEGNCNCGGTSQSATYEYDSNLNNTKIIDALNQETTYTYDSNGNQLNETSVLGTETFTYNSFGQVLTRTDRMSGVTTNTYDAQGNLLTTKDPLNKTTTFTYTTIGQLQTVKDARNNTTTLTYDTAGRLTEIKDADNKTTVYGYDARARVTSATNALNQTTVYEYDSRNRLKKVTYPDAKFVTYNYDLAGRRTSMVDARNNTTTYGYDNAYRLTSVTDPLNHTTAFGYDLMSNRTSVTDALGNTTNYEFDNFDRLKKIVYPAATTGAARLEERMEYDAVGNVKKRIDTANRETLYDYDTAHRLIKITDPDLKLTQFEYNNRSQMTKVTDASSQVYNFTYDPLGRVLSQTRAGVTAAFEYDATGNRTKRTDYKGVVTTYVYDNLNRLQTIVYPVAAENVSLTYDALSQLKTATNQNGTITFNYDNRNRVESATDVWNKTVAYGYDANGNRDLLKLDGTNYAAYAYDVANRLTGITAADDNTQVTLGYDNANKLTSRNYPNGVSTTFEYDNMSRLKRLKDASATATLFDRQHSYNAANQISQIAEPTKTRSFGYDNLDRLTNVTPSVGTNEIYAFDAVGNRTASHLSSTYTHQPFNRLTATANATFGYDNNGNLTSKTDGAGTWIYEWDYENRLKKATKPNGDYVVYKYDALGRRIERSLNGGAFTRFTYDGQEVLVDNDSALGTVKYLNGLGIDNKLRQVVNGQAQYFLTDHLGSTNALVDAAGGVAAQTGYDTFGNQTSALPTRYGFTGRERDDFTGLMHYRARQYSPELGRFISEDPIGFRGKTLNFYEYVQNRPLMLKDPSGLIPILDHYLWYFYSKKCGETAINCANSTNNPNQTQQDLEKMAMKMFERGTGNISGHRFKVGMWGNEDCQEMFDYAKDVWEGAFPLFLHDSKDEFGSFSKTGRNLIQDGIEGKIREWLIGF